MTYDVAGPQPNFSRRSPPSGQDPKAVLTAAADSKPANNDAVYAAVLKLLRELADRFQPEPPPFDPQEMSWALRACTAGPELNLCKLTLLERTSLAALLAKATADDLIAFKDVVGFVYVELDATLLVKTLSALEQLGGLHCISVWAPDEGGALDFGTLQGGGREPLRINILGSPREMLDITVFETGVKLQARETSNRAIQASRVRTRNEAGDVSIQTQPLAPPQKHAPAHRPMHQPTHGREAIEAVRSKLADCLPGRPDLAEALAACAGFNPAGDLGFDLGTLASAHARWVDDNPGAAFSTLQLAVKEAGEDISWLHLHDDIGLGEPLLAALNQLEPLLTLRIPAPADKLPLRLDKLQGGNARLQEVQVRPRPRQEDFALVVPCMVDVRLAEGAVVDDETMQRSTVCYAYRSGKQDQESEMPFMQAHEAAIAGKSAWAPPPLRRKLHERLHDSPEVADALDACAAVDDQERFGFDLKGLAPATAKWVQDNPDKAFSALQLGAKAVRRQISWLDLHDQFIMSGELVGALNTLDGLRTLCLATPLKGLLLLLDKLQGGNAALEEIQIRTRPEQRRFAIEIPIARINVRLAEGFAVDNAVLEQSKVYYVDKTGKRQGQVSLLAAHEAALAGNVAWAPSTPDSPHTKV
jgi:hypothetical protein